MGAGRAGVPQGPVRWCVWPGQREHAPCARARGAGVCMSGNMYIYVCMCLCKKHVSEVSDVCRRVHIDCCVSDESVYENEPV